MALQGQRGIK